MGTFISILIFLVCILLVLIVLVQNPKGGGLASEFSSANQIGGVQRTADFLEKATWTLAIALVVLSLVSASYSTSSKEQQQVQESMTEDIIQDHQLQQPVPAKPGQQLPKGAAPQNKGQDNGQQEPEKKQ